LSPPATAPEPIHERGGGEDRRNSFAVAGLVLGIMTLPPFRHLFSVIGHNVRRRWQVGMTIVDRRLVLNPVWGPACGVAARVRRAPVIKANTREL